MELDRIHDAATLERALRGLPEAAALALAVRAALRTVPLMELWLEHDEEEAMPMLLPTFRPLAASWAVALEMAAALARQPGPMPAPPQAGMLATATDAAIRHATRAVARATSVVANTPSNKPFGYARIAFAASVRAAYAATSNAHEGSAGRAIAHIGQAAQGWGAISADIAALRELRDARARLAGWLLSTPLWPATSEVPAWAEEYWPAMKARLLARQDEHWRVWTDWQDRHLRPPANDTGRFEEQIELEKLRAMMPEAVWRQDAAAVNAAIAQLAGAR